MNKVTIGGWTALCALAWVLAACGGGGGGGGGGGNGGQGGQGGQAGRVAVATTNSSPIALTSDSKFVWTVNPDNDSVSLMEVAGDANRKLKEIQVGAEPQCVAITPDDKKVYVTNAVSGTVSVIDAASQNLTNTITVGTEPFGCALTPDGKKLYVANFSSDNVSVIDTSTDKVLKTIDGVGPKPRGIAIGAFGEQTKVYVTQFLAQVVNDGRPIDRKEGADDGKEGRVTVISTDSDTILKTIALAAHDTGFKSDGSTLDKTVFDGTDATKVATKGFPNLLESIVIKGGRAYLPNTASSPSGPVKFNVNVQGFVSVIDTATDQEVSDATFNMNKGVQFEPKGKKLFITNPSALAFKHNDAVEGFVLSRATDRLVRLVLDANGKPTINAPTAASDPGNIVRVEVGVDTGEFHNSSPQGVVINSTDTRAYVMNFITRDVSVVDVSGDPAQYREIARIPSAALPQPGTLAAVIHRGNELFNTSIGPAGTADNAQAPAGRMSDFGWGSCYSCHPRGLTDGVTWMFGDGPRQTISMESTFAHPQPAGAQVNANGAPILPAFHQRALNWSAVRDEVQGFELNIRGVSGGQGLIAFRDPVTGERGAQDPCVFNLVFAANANCDVSRAVEAAITTGRDADLDAISAYIASGIRQPIAAVADSDPQAVEGRQLFQQANCHACHGGVNWTASKIDFAPPPAGTEIDTGQLKRFLCKVGSFDANAFNEIKAGNAATGQNALNPANGALGFNIPSLVSVFASAPYFHSGKAQSLEEFAQDTTHRTLGTGGNDLFNTPDKQAALVKFLKSIDLSEPAFPDSALNPAQFCQP